MNYRPVIGLETHIQLNTVTKLMCSCLNEYNPNSPNKNICEFCTGQPGALPLLNQEAMRKAIRLGVALGSTIPELTSFDRKNYFYPDLPNGYQISQFAEPLVIGGNLVFYIENKDKAGFEESSVKLTRAHLETDAAKLIHAGGKTLVDFNRSGAPLIEIVTEPVIHSAEQAMAYVTEMQLLVRKLNISDADMEKGQMRFDINISLQNLSEQTANKLPNYRAEIKNVNSVRSLGRAVQYEIERQTKLLEAGTIPVQETRGWDDDKGVTSSQRSKEDATDYRYFPEPDILPIQIRPSDIPSLSDLDELPSVQRSRYTASGLSLTTAIVLTNNTILGTTYDAVLKTSKKINVDLAKTVANLITVILTAKAEEQNSSIDTLLTPPRIREIAEFYVEGTLNNLGVQKILDLLIVTPEVSITDLVDMNNLRQVNDDSILLAFVDAVLEHNPSIVEQFRSGKEQVIGFLVGQCMKESKGSGNPQKFQELLRLRLAV